MADVLGESPVARHGQGEPEDARLEAAYERGRGRLVADREPGEECGVIRASRE